MGASTPIPLRRADRLSSGGDENELLRWASHGDRDAQQALLVQHMPRARRTITRLVGATHEVEDLLQTTCIEVLRSLPRFKGDASFALWMDRIATHVVYKHFRSNDRRRRRVREAAQVDMGGPAPSDDPGKQVEVRRAYAQLRRLIEGLNPDRRMIFLLVSIDGRTLEEAAALLGIRLAAAKSRYLRARRQVDRLLMDHPALLEVLDRDRDRGEARRD